MAKPTNKEKYERFVIDGMDGVTFSQSPKLTPARAKANDALVAARQKKQGIKTK